MKYVYKNKKTYKFTKKLKIYLTILLAVLISTTGYLISNASFSKFNDYQTIFNEETEDGINVVVDAKPNTIPKNATLEIEKITDESEEAIKESINEVKEDELHIAKSYTYDICIFDEDGNEIEPSSDVRISFQSDEINNKNLDTKIYHTTTDEDNTIEKTEKLKETVENDTVIATTDSFSYYTVAFTYNDKTYNLGGDEEVKLDEILNTLELEGEVTNVESSNNELFYPELREDGYYIVSIAPFDTEEYLNVTIDDIVYKIDVTDATATVSLTFLGAGPGDINYIGKITFTYTVNTNDATTYKITITKVTYKNDSGSSQDFSSGTYDTRLKVTLFGTKVKTYSGTVGKGKTVTLWSGSKSKSWTKTHESQEPDDVGLVQGWVCGAEWNPTIPAKTHYTITYNANGGSGAPGSGTKWYNEAFTVSSTKPTRTGYNFVNWKITQTGNTVGAGGTITAGSNNNYDLVAQWSEKTATLTYANGGHGTAPANATMKYTTATNAAGALSATGYTFTGWKRSDTGAVIAAGAQVKAANVEPSAITLTAQWSEKTATLTYNNGGHGTAPANVTMKYSAATNAASAISATGYTFTGWKRSDNNTVIAAGAQVKAANVEPAALTLTAQWTKNTYTIGYTLNGGTKGTNGPTSGTYDTDVQISNPTKTVTVTGNVNNTGATVGAATSKAQTFSGWTSTTLGSNAKTGTAANPTTAWSGSSTKNTYFRNLRESGTVTMVANWTPVAVTLPTLSKAGHSCSWYTASTGGSLMGGSGASWTPGATSNAAVTAYARCTENTATLTYANGGHGTAPSNVTMKYSTATNAAVALSATGYNFTGWKRSDTGAVIAAGAQVKAANVNPTALTLTAQWSEKTATLTYNNGGHGTAPANATMKYTTATNAASALSATGYTFNGWKRSDTGAVIAAGAQVKAANVEPAALTLTAQWTPYKLTLKYHVNGGTITTDTSQATRWRANSSLVQRSTDSGATWADITAVINTDTTTADLWNVGTYNAKKTGYSISGTKAYNTKADGTGVNINQDHNASSSPDNAPTVARINGGALTADKTMNIYVNWIPNTYTIGYTLNGGNNPSTKPTSGTYDKDVQISNPTKTVTVTGNVNNTGATIGAAQSKAQTFSGWTSTTLGSNAKTGTAANPTTAWSGSSTKNTYFRNLRESGTATMVANWTPVAVTLPTLSKTGYTCKWYTDATAGSLMGAGGASWTPGANSAAAVTAYARCTENTATLTYANGGHGTAPANVTMKYTTATNAAAALSATGYNFTGWKRSDTGAVIAAGAQVKGANVNPTALTLTAQWSEKTATLTYNNGGHGTAPGNVTMKYTTATNAASAISATGYTFNGWKRSDNNTVIAAGAQVKAANVEPSALTLTAQWTANTYTIGYTLNGGNNPSTKPTSGTYDHDVQISNPTKTVTVTGNANGTGLTVGAAQSKEQTFSGWTSTTLGSNAKTGTAANPTTAWSGSSTKNTYFRNLRESGTVTMVANWTPVAVTLPTLSAKTGYTCKWYTASSGGSEMGGSGASWTPGATSNAAVTAYARCTANTYTIGYTLNGGNNPSTKPTSGTYDTDVQISNPTKTVTVTGNVNNTGATIGAAQSKAQTFSGWTSTTLGSNAKTGTAANPTTAWTGSSTKNTYFKNLRESGTVTMVANWTPVAVTLPTLSKAGHSCSWYTASTGGSLMGGSGASWTPGATSNAAVTAYARCTENTATLTYNNGGHGTAPSNATMKYSAATNAAAALSATGYNFTGWKRSDTGAVIAAGAQVKGANVNPTALTLTAQWSEKTATLTYNNGGHGTAPGNVTMKYTTATNAASAISATGYTFNGWKRSDNNTVIAAGAQVKAANVEPSALTLTAQWTANTYTIGYTLNGGNNPSTKPTSGTYDTDVVISNPTKTVTVTGNVNNTGATVGTATSKAQTFSGWTSTTLGSNAKTGTAANPTTAWTGSSTKNTYFRNLRESGTVTMIANWTPVAFNLPTATKTGYTCKWYSSSGTSGGTLIGTSGGSYTPSATSAASVTVYARCTNAKLTVTQQVKGSIANTNKEFNYTLNVKNNGTNISGTYAYTGTKSGNLTFTNGNATFKLKHGQNIEITFPSDYTYTITQVNDGYTVSKTNDSGTLSSDKTASFTNTLEGTTPTGIFTDIFPYVLLLVCGVGIIIWIKRFKYI